jgi:integrase
VTSWKVYPRGGVYYADIYLDRPLPGTKVKRIQKSTGTRLDEGEGAARVQAQRMVDAVERGMPASAVASGGSLTVKGWCETWCARREMQGKLDWKHEAAHLRDHLYPWVGHRPIGEVSKAEMLTWVRGLAKHGRTDGKDGTISGRTCHNVANTVRHAFKHAAKEDVILVSPCVWDATDLPEKDGNKDRLEGGFTLEQVATLIYDRRIPEDRRILYAMEFLTGMRPGEAAVRRWKDWNATEKPLGLLVAASAWNTRARVEKTTKTRVTKWLPVHPALDKLLRAWKRDGFARMFGRPPEPMDFIVPSRGGSSRNWPAGQPRNNGHSWNRFQHDLDALGFPRQQHYETRATFRSLALAGGGDLHAVDLITHPSPKQAKDLYERRRLLWPSLCKAVACIHIAPPRPKGLRLVK